MPEIAMRWFGEPWLNAAGANGGHDPDKRVPVPVGDPCFSCRVPIVDDDRGLVFPREGRPESDAFHLGCIRTILADRETTELYLDGEFRTSLDDARNGRTVPVVPLSSFDEDESTEGS